MEVAITITNAHPKTIALSNACQIRDVHLILIIIHCIVDVGGIYSSPPTQSKNININLNHRPATLFRTLILHSIRPRLIRKRNTRPLSSKRIRVSPNNNSERK